MPATERGRASPGTVVLYTADPWDSAMPVLRVRGPLQQVGLEVIPGNEGVEVDPYKVSEADIVVIQRDFPRFADPFLQVFRNAQQQRKPVIYEIDDLLLALPAGHISRKDLSDVLLPVLWAICEADAVTTSTTHLRDYLRPFNPNIWVLPNLLNDNLWSLRQTALSDSGSQPVTIGYMGGQTHLPDLRTIQPVLEQALARHAGEVRLKFWGGAPPEALLNHPAVTWTPMDILDYEAFAQFFSAQACDIFIAPLVDNPFNRAKSAIKFLEYSALGTPGIYSRIPAYEQVVAHGENGFLAASLEEWQAVLETLITNPELRLTIGRAAQETIQRDWLLSRHAGQWTQVYQQILASRIVAAPERLERLRIVAQAAQQVQDRHRALENELEADQIRLAQLDQILNSRSWQLLQQVQHLRHQLAPPNSRRETLLSKLGLLSRRS